MLGVSRGTLRTALERLERTGEIVRRQGSGTFVGRVPVSHTFGERLERLEPYSSVAARRGLQLRAVDVTLDRAAVGRTAAEALGLAPATIVTTLSRTLLADGSPVAVMDDVLHPDLALPPDGELTRLLEDGQMVLDVLLHLGVAISHARTRVMPTLISARQRVGRRLGIRGATACLELEEVIYAGLEQRIVYSVDLFAPDAIDVMVMRSLDHTLPAPVLSRRVPTAARGEVIAGSRAAGRTRPAA